MIQKIIASMLHAVSNPHRFDVIIFDKIVRLYDVYIYLTIKVTQLFLWVPYTRSTLLVYVPNVELTNVVADKKNFFVCNNMSHNFFMLTKIFCWHNFFQNFFSFNYFLQLNIPLFSLQEANIKVFPLQANIIDIQI